VDTATAMPAMDLDLCIPDCPARGFAPA